MLKFLKRFWIILLTIIVILWIVVVLYLQHPKFGAKPSWDRLARIEQSPNYHDGQFWNLSDTPLMTTDENWENNTSIFSRLETDDNNRSPKQDIPSVKTDLKSLPKDENVLVWLGHSAYFMILDWKTYLVDPTLVTGSPVWFVNKPFPWTTIYTPDDIPEIDYLIITHDHYDHLDYYTMKEIKDRVWKVVTSLWVWAHLEKWWFAPEDIIEMDWYDESDLENDIKITCLPARHYAWRLFNQNNTLWSSFMLETENKTIYIWWDSWYDKFFKEYWEKWTDIDLAILENGQYNQQWKYIHMLPDDVVQAIKDLNADKVFTVHNSKYAMAYHDWDEPMKALDERLQKEWIDDQWITPIIGQVVELDNIDNQTFTRWWNENTKITNETENYSCSATSGYSCTESAETNETDFTALEENADNIQTKLWWLTPEDALEYMKNTENLIIIDTRDLEVKPNSFVWWIEIPWNQMESRYTEIPEWASVLLHCWGWNVAPKAYEALLKINPNLNSLGYIAWTPLFDEYNNLFSTENSMAENLIYLKVWDKIFDITLVDNSSTKALLEKLKEWDIIVNAHDYWNFEKVWDLGFTLPRNDEQITTELWDLILYQWNQITVYYDTNSWNFTRLWKVHNISKSDLWDWDVTLIFSLIN